MLYVANWKMNKSFAEALEFAKHYRDDLHFLSVQNKCQLVLCPSFPALYPLSLELKHTMISIGAQTCSAYPHGAYTGQVSAKSINEAGATYCIVGHSETRKYSSQPPEEIGAQVARLIEQNIHPIICIGEIERDDTEILMNQLNAIFPALQTIENPFSIAYEPAWAIGGGKAASPEHINKAFSWIKKEVQKELPSKKWQLLYGGSVDEQNVAKLKKIAGLDGFLIGSASLDFQKLQKIVL